MKRSMVLHMVWALVGGPLISLILVLSGLMCGFVAGKAAAMFSMRGPMVMAFASLFLCLSLIVTLHAYGAMIYVAYFYGPAFGGYRLGRWHSSWGGGI